MKIELSKTLLDQLARYRATSAALQDADYSTMSADDVMAAYNANRDDAHALAMYFDIAVRVEEAGE